MDLAGRVHDERTVIVDRLVEWLGRVFPDPAARRPTPGALPARIPHPSLPIDLSNLEPVNIAVTHVARRCAAIEGIDSDSQPYLRHCVTLTFTGVTPGSPDPITTRVTVPSKNIPLVVGVLQDAYWHYMSRHRVDEGVGVVRECEQ